MEIKILGVPMDLGASRRGTDMGPSALRVARVGPKLAKLGHNVEDLGNVYSPTVETRTAKEASLLYLDEIVSVCEILARRVERIVLGGAVPLVLGGDHSIALGTVGGIVRAVGGPNVGIVWMDAHADFNTTETTLTGNVHGMPLAAIVGIGSEALTSVGGIRPKARAENVVLVGLRDVDPEESKLLKKSGVTVYTMKEIDERGMRNVMEDALDIASSRSERIHVSFDMDVVDPRYAPGVGTPVPGGITYREAHLAMEMVAESPKFKSLEVVEVNPLMDHRNETAELACGLIASAFGKRIL